MGVFADPLEQVGWLGHILVVTPWYPTETDPLSGTFVRDHVASIAGQSSVTVVRIHDPFVAAPTRRGNVRIVDQADPWPVYEAWGDDRFGIAGTALAMARALRRVRTDVGTVDLIHAHVWSAAVLCVLLNRPAVAPLVITEHSTALLGDPRPLDGRRLRAARAAYLRADEVIAVGTRLAEAIASLGVDLAKLTVVGNPVDPEVFTLGPGGNAIVGVGALESRKRFDLLVEAFGVVKRNRPDLSHKLLIVGDGPDRAPLHDYADRLGLGRDVAFLGHLPKGEIAHLLSRSDAHVSTSSTETFGVTIVESLFAGTPVVATPSGGPQDIIGEGDGVVIPGWKVGEVVNGIEAVLHISEASVRRQTRRDRAVARFSCDAIGRELLASYGRAMNTHLRRR